MPDPVVFRRMLRSHDRTVHHPVRKRPVRTGREGRKIRPRHIDALALEQNNGGMGPGVTLDRIQDAFRPLLGSLLIHQKIKRQMARHALPTPGRKLLGEFQHGFAEGRVGRQGFVVHEQFGGGAGDEGADLAGDDERVRAVFVTADELLQHPGVGVGDVDVGETFVSFADGGAGKEGHVCPGSVVDADAFHDVLRRLVRVQYLVHCRSRGDVVGLRRGQAKPHGVLNEGVLLMQQRCGVDIVLDRFAVGAALEDFFRHAVLDRGSHARAADPEVDLLAAHHLQQALDIVSRTILLGWLRQRIESAQHPREAAADGNAVGFEIRADDIVPGFVEGTGDSQSLGHTNAGNKDGLGAEVRRAADALAQSALRAEDLQRITEEEYEGREWEKEETEEDERDVLGEMQTRGGLSGEHC